MKIYRPATIITRYSLWCVILIVSLSIADHFLFGEKYRSELGLLFKVSLVTFFSGVVVGLAKGVLDKLGR